MGNLNEIVNEIVTILNTDVGISDFSTANYEKDICVRATEFNIAELPLKDIPVIIVSDNFDAREKRRFLFHEHEANLQITCGLIQNDQEKVHNELITFKNLIKTALKKDPLLNGNAVYSTIVKSKRLKMITHPLYFMEMTMYVNFRTQ